MAAAKDAATTKEASKTNPTRTREKRELSQTTVVTEAILDNLEYDTMGDSWLAALEPELQKPYFLQVNICYMHPFNH